MFKDDFTDKWNSQIKSILTKNLASGQTNSELRSPMGIYQKIVKISSIYQKPNRPKFVDANKATPIKHQLKQSSICTVSSKRFFLSPKRIFLQWCKYYE